MKIRILPIVTGLIWISFANPVFADAYAQAQIQAQSQAQTQTQAQTEGQAQVQTSAGPQGVKEKPKQIASVPILSGGFVFGASGLYFVPVAVSNTTYGAITDLAYASEITFPSNTLVLNTKATGPYLTTRSLETGPQYNKGFAIHLGYIFPGTGNDVMLNWYHFNTSRTAYSAAPGITVAGTNTAALLKGAYIPPFLGTLNVLTGLSPQVGNTAPFQLVSGRSSSQWNTVDLNFGQHIKMSDNVKLRFAAGLAWAKVSNELEANYSGTNVNTSVFFDEDGNTIDSHDLQISGTYIDTQSTFKGLGPEINIDGKYCYIGTDFSLAGHLGGQMLVGNIDSFLNLLTTNFGSTTDVTTTTSGTILSSTLISTSVSQNASYLQDHQILRVVPELDANVGIDYTYNFASPSTSSFDMEVGYQANEYFNVIRVFENINGNDLQAQRMFFHGPFLMVKFLV